MYAPTEGRGRENKEIQSKGERGRGGEKGREGKKEMKGVN